MLLWMKPLRICCKAGMTALPKVPSAMHRAAPARPAHHERQRPQNRSASIGTTSAALYCKTTLRQAPDACYLHALNWWVAFDNAEWDIDQLSSCSSQKLSRL